MTSDYFSEHLDLPKIGEQMYQLIRELYPICRSITGNGIRESIRLLGQHIALNTFEIPSGTQVFDWTVPKEWNIRDAYVKNSKGEKIIDFKKLNLHVVGYSMPISKKVSLDELKAHLFSIPEYPDWIPYRASYYEEYWGFCVSHRMLQQLEDEEYEVYIDSVLENGSMCYGEYYLGGKTVDEILISCHCCHPSLCNDNLSGMALATYLAKHLSLQATKYSYRFIFIPATIGSIAWLFLNENKVSNIKHGLVIAGVGDPGKLRYKKSRRGDAEIDRAAIHVLKHSGQDFEIIEFSPYGYDERQYCSPGFNLNIGSLTRTPFGRYPEYHSSADNLEFVHAEYLADSLCRYIEVLSIVEENGYYKNAIMKCEPQLGKRGLYKANSGHVDKMTREMAMLWILNLSDGNHSLLDIAERADMPFPLICKIARTLVEHKLLE
jgi:aminopeptidase-like protein